MEINLFTSDQAASKDLISFFMSIKKIKFVFKDILLLNNFKNANNLIVISRKIKSASLIILIKKYKSFNLSNSCFFIPNIFLKERECKKISSIYYPIKIDTFEHQLKNCFLAKKYSYKNFYLKNNNFLINNLNNKEVYLTEIESKIIKLLFTSHRVLKQTINSDVLSQQPGVESKSLESHLYRLRKKMLNLGEGEIIADGEKSIKIK